ncbi:subunit of tubulin prefoldin, partial [Ceratobasidium sp. 414]
MSQQPQQVNVADLDLPQLNDVKKQLDEELTHLTNSFAQLKAAQSKFKGCLDNLDEIKPETA